MIQFFLKGTKGKQHLIMMRINNKRAFNNGRFVYSTREFVDPGKWDIKTNRPKDNPKLKMVLNDLDQHVEDYMRENKFNGFTSESLRDHLNEKLLLKRAEQNPLFTQGEEVRPLTLVEQWEAFLKNIKGTCKDTSWKRYCHSLEHFKTHMTEAKQLSMSPAKFTEERYNEFLGYLRDNLAPNTAATVLKHFKRVVKKIAAKEIKVGLNPTEVIKYKQKAGVQIALDDDILEKLYKYKFNKYLSVIRWTFLLQCYTGLRVSDLFRVINKNLHGKTHIVFETQKVEGNNVRQAITAQARDILEKLDYQVPQISVAYYNREIKTIYKAVDEEGTTGVRTNGKIKMVPIHEKIRSHDAVRTFITRCMNRGITAATVASATGKTIDVILKHYYVPSQRVASDEMLAKF